MSKAADMLIKSISINERSESFLTSIKRNIQKDVLDKLQSYIDNLNDKIFEKTDFTLATNMNKGQSAISRNNAEQRFKEIIELEYELELVKLEMKAKQASFDKYFKDEPAN